MQTKTYNVYKFDELSEQAQQKALDNLRTINIDYYWWEFEWWDTDIFNLAFSKVFFDLDRGSYLNVTDAISIINEDKFYDLIGLNRKLAKKYNYAFYSKNETNTRLELERIDDTEETESDLMQVNIAIDNFDKLIMEWIELLREEYSYLQSDEAIKETIEAMDYDFTEDGELD